MLYGLKKRFFTRTIKVNHRNIVSCDYESGKSVVNELVKEIACAVVSAKTARKIVGRYFEAFDTTATYIIIDSNDLPFSVSNNDTITLNDVIHNIVLVEYIDDILVITTKGIISDRSH